jgi:hypothetical protein
MKNISFKKFLISEEESFFSAMGKLGIHKDDYKKFPQYASFFALGRFPVNFGNYSILDYKKNENGDITHVLVKKINDSKVSSLNYDKNNNEKLNQSDEDERFLISIDDLEELMSQGNQQQQDPGQMGGLM